MALIERRDNLPETYRGFTSDELLKLWKLRRTGKLDDDTPEETVLILEEFLREFGLGIHAPEVKKRMDELISRRDGKPQPEKQ